MQAHPPVQLQWRNCGSSCNDAVFLITNKQNTSFFCLNQTQASSGAGAAAMEELWEQTKDVVNGKPAQPKIFPVQVCVCVCSVQSSYKGQGVLTSCLASKGTPVPA